MREAAGSVEVSGGLMILINLLIMFYFHKREKW